MTSVDALPPGPVFDPADPGFIVSPVVRRPTFQFRGYDRLEIALSGAGS
jgi:hypothetical protein